MHGVDDHTMLSRFIFRKREEIYKKFSHTTKEEGKLIESFIKKIKANKVDF